MDSVSAFFRRNLGPLFGYSSTSSGRSRRGDGPTVAFVDNISPNSKGKIDIDGDGVGDLSHGAVSAMYLKSKMPGARVLMENSEGDPREAINNNYDAIQVGCEGRINAFNRLSAKVRKGQKLDAVNFSVATSGTTMKELAQVTGLPLTPANAKQYENEIRAKLSGLAERLDSGTLSETQYKYGYFWKVIQSMERLTSQGVPIYLAAGNEGPEHINMYSLARGTKTVGAVNAKGEKTSYSSDSQFNPFITSFAQGDYNVRHVQHGGQSGVSITGNDKVDIPAHLLSGRGRFVNRRLATFSGKQSNQFLLKPEEIQLLQRGGGLAQARNLIPQSELRLISVDTYGALNRMSPDAIGRMKSMGTLTTLDGKLVFRTQANGRLFYSPDGSSDRGDTIHVNRGTSFAAPAQMMGDLSKRYRLI
ncbi:MAG: hypothetical protein K2X66_13640 [Cyanobacteria bacterium]|nr:hypothetical protein [Cyanobacteriota bacterium]